MREFNPGTVAEDRQLSRDARNAGIKLAGILFHKQAVPFEVLITEKNFPPEMISAAADYLREAGCELATTNVGIKMQRLSWRLIAPVVGAVLAQQGMELDIQIFAQTPSTNDECFAAAARGADRPMAIMAEAQTQGRGRRGNRWEAKPGQSALVSLLLPGRELSVETLSLAAGLAVAESVEELTGGNPELKWPNDVLIDNHKLSGVLIETRPNVLNPMLTDYVIGVGMNVMQTNKDFPDSLAARATSLNMIGSRKWDVPEVIAVLLGKLYLWCNPLAPGEEIVPLWLSRCRMLERHIRVSCAGRIIEGTVADIDPMEGLIIRDHQGMNHACLASQTTVLRD